MEELRVVLLGKRGAGKSSAGNTLLGKQPFHTAASSQGVTKGCCLSTCNVDGHKISVVDTPGWSDIIQMDEKIIQEIAEWIDQSHPGPHVFLLVLPIGRFTKEEIDTVQQILEVFGEEACKYTMVLFTRGDDLEEKTIEEQLKDTHQALKKILEVCGGRYHVFNNRDKSQKQVTELLEKIKQMAKRNEGRHYTKAMYQNTVDQMEGKWKRERIIKAIREEVEEEMNDSGAGSNGETMRSNNAKLKPRSDTKETVSTKKKKGGKCSFPEETERQQVIVGQNQGRNVCNNQWFQNSNAMVEYFEQGGQFHFSAKISEDTSNKFDEMKSQMEMQINPEMERMINNMMQVWFKEKSELNRKIQELQEDFSTFISVLKPEQVKAFNKLKAEKNKTGSISSSV